MLTTHLRCRRQLVEKHKRFFIGALLALLSSSVLAQVGWQFDNGPWYANIQDFAVGLKNNQVVLYAADSVDVAQIPNAFVLKSTNRGESWEHKTINASGMVRCVATVHSNADIIYAGIPNVGIYKSTDGGTSFVAVNNGLGNMQLRKIAVSPHDQNVVYAGCAKHFGSLATLFKSTNGGGNWNRVEPFNVNQLTVTSIVFDAQDDRRIWIAGHDAYPNNTGVWFSRDRGQTWEQRNSGMTNAKIGALVGNPDNPAVLYAANADVSPERKIYKTVNGTDSCTWTPKYTDNSGLTFTDMRINPNNSSRVFLSMRNPYGLGGVLRSTDGGQNWQLQQERIRIGFLNAIEVDPDPQSQSTRHRNHCPSR